MTWKLKVLYYLGQCNGIKHVASFSIFYYKIVRMFHNILSQKQNRMDGLNHSLLEDSYCRTVIQINNINVQMETILYSNENWNVK